MTLIGNVSLHDADAEAHGDRAYVDMRRETFEILGAPAHVRHPRGTLDAPHAVYRRDAGIVQADGGVAAVLVEGGRALAPGSPAANASDEPLRVEAKEAIWQAEPSTVRFLGGVRAWQGANTLFAEQLRGEPDRGWMAASGGVRTVWQQAAGDAEPTAAEARRRRACRRRRRRTARRRPTGSGRRRRRRRATERPARDHRGGDELQRGRGVAGLHR